MREAYETWFKEKFGLPPMPIHSRVMDFCWAGYQAGVESMNKPVNFSEWQKLVAKNAELRQQLAELLGGRRSDSQEIQPNQYKPGTSMIILESLNSAADLKKGDLLLISYDAQVIAAKVKELNVLPNNGGTEVIYNKKKNQFFNIMLYLKGKSWVKNVRIVRLCR